MNKHGALLIVFVFLLIGFLAVSLWSPRASLQEKVNSHQLNVEDIRVENRTSAFELVGIEKTDDTYLKLSLKNSYDKNITAIEISIGRVRMTEEFIYNENQVIAPGAIFTKIYPSQPMLTIKGIVILTVVFEDGTGDGDPNLIRAILDRRLGEAIQFTNFLPLLQEVLDSPDDQLPTSLARLKSKVSSLSNNSTGSLSASFQYGLHNGKQDLLEEIKKLETNKKTIKKIP